MTVGYTGRQITSHHRNRYHHQSPRHRNRPNQNPHRSQIHQSSRHRNCPNQNYHRSQIHNCQKHEQIDRSGGGAIASTELIRQHQEESDRLPRQKSVGLSVRITYCPRPQRSGKDPTSRSSSTHQKPTLAKATGLQYHWFPPCYHPKFAIQEVHPDRRPHHKPPLLYLASQPWF